MRLNVRECSLVIAKHNENISWITKFSKNLPIFIYNKNNIKFSNIGYSNINIIHRPNIGREAETYLYHITQNYYALTKWVIFCQGNPFDHFIKFLSIFNCDIENINHTGINGNRFYGVGKKYLLSRKTTDNWQTDIVWPAIDQVHNFIFPNVSPLETTMFARGANMVVSSENIRIYPKIWYANLLKYIINNNYSPWAMEALWDTIWNNQNNIIDSSTFS